MVIGVIIFFFFFFFFSPLFFFFFFFVFFSSTKILMLSDKTIHTALRTHKTHLKQNLIRIIFLFHYFLYQNYTLALMEGSWHISVTDCTSLTGIESLGMYSLCGAMIHFLQLVWFMWLSGACFQTLLLSWQTCVLSHYQHFQKLLFLCVKHVSLFL